MAWIFPFLCISSNFHWFLSLFFCNTCAFFWWFLFGIRQKVWRSQSFSFQWSTNIWRRQATPAEDMWPYSSFNIQFLGFCLYHSDEQAGSCLMFCFICMFIYRFLLILLAFFRCLEKLVSISRSCLPSSTTVWVGFWWPFWMHSPSFQPPLLQSLPGSSPC